MVASSPSHLWLVLIVYLLPLCDGYTGKLNTSSYYLLMSQ